VPVPNITGQSQEPVIERSGLIATGLGHAVQAFGPADSVFDLNTSAGISRILGSLNIGQGRVGAFFAAEGLTVGQRLGGEVVVGHQNQVAQIGQ
jgi:hypothetical protein